MILAGKWEIAVWVGVGEQLNVGVVLGGQGGGYGGGGEAVEASGGGGKVPW